MEEKKGDRPQKNKTKNAFLVGYILPPKLLPVDVVTEDQRPVQEVCEVHSAIDGPT